MNAEHSILLQIAMGLGLASSAGLRAFVPMLVAGVAARLGWVHLGESFTWLASWPALSALGVMSVAELLADKVPMLDHAVDVLHLWLKPIAGTLVAASMFTDMPAQEATGLGLLFGGATAWLVHLGKAKLRVLSSATSAGMANPLISGVEDVIAIVFACIAILIPLLVVVLLLATAAMLFRAVRRRGRSHPPL